MRKILITWLVMLWLTMWYSYAWLQEFDLWLAEEITANVDLWYSLLLQSNANFIVNDEYKIIRFQWNASNYNRIITYFWNGTWMYMISTKNYGDYWVKAEWFLNYVNIVTLSTIDYSQQVPVWYTPIEQFISNSRYSNPDKLLLWWYWDLQAQSLCFWYTEYDEAVCFTLNDVDIEWNISNSMWLWVQSIENLVSYATNSPFTQTTPTQTQVNNFQCRTIQQLIDAYPEDYTIDLCYSSTKYLSWWQRITTPEKTIFELYPEFVNLRQDYNLYTNYCTPPATMQACQNAFTWKEDNYTLIQKIPSWVQPLRLYQYCNYQLNMDHNATTCVTSTWSLNWWTGVTINDIINEIWDRQREVTLPWTPPQEDNTNGSWSIFDKYTQQLENHNIFDDLQELYTKITWIFRSRQWTKGIIPELITWLICLVVLFKLFKK